MPARLALLVSFVLALGLLVQPLATSAQTSEDAAARAAREIQEARDRANAASEEFFEAEAELYALQDRAVALEREAEQLEATVAELRSEVESVAVNRFVTSGSGGIPLFTGIQDPQEQVQAEVFVDVLTNVSSDAFDQYDLARADLEQTRAALDAQQAEIEQQQRRYAQLQEAAEAEVERLRAVEEQRLQDEAVQKALEAQLAAQLAEAEEEARQAAAAQAAAQPNPAAAPSTDAANAPGVDPLVDDSGGDDADDDGDSDSSSPDPTPAPTQPPTTVAPNTGSSGGTSGGRTGASGGGSTPAPVPQTPVAGIVCPMPGSAYGDTFGAPRSGGRSHEGVDMLAPRGTPIYAVASGYATFKQTRLGGNSVSLAADNGTRYFYAHLSSFEGSSRRVAQGDLIGYNGDTGNASGVPHLHFEIHPGGGAAINPTPSVRAAGC